MAYAPTAAGVVCLVGVSGAPPGATRVCAWPWALLYAAAVVGPLCTLIARAFDRERPLAIARRGWQWLALATVLGILLSALLSPHRSASLLWSAPLLAAVALFW